jgi:glycosyltransferase involved in cell wall biosynthesis
MRVLLAHNDYGQFSGEEAAVENIAAILEAKGHEVQWMRRSSAEIGGSVRKKVGSFFSGIYSPGSRQVMARLLDRGGFDLVQVQNLYPFLSASILAVCRERSLPVVMRCPNYRLFCPSGLHLRDGGVCEDCLLGSREWHCLRHNCEGDIFKSLGYAARNAFARVTGMIRDNVTVFVVLSEFQKQRFVEAGIPPNQIEILANTAQMPADCGDSSEGAYVAFVGRVSEEKGIREILEAAKRLPDVPFRVAGSTNALPGIERQAPDNVEFLGFLSGATLDDFYKGARILVSPSKWFEGFPNTIAQAMAYAKPVVATRIGAAPEIVEDGVTGLLAEPGDAVDLAEKIHFLWERPEACAAMGASGRRKAQCEYSEERFYQKLMAIYAKAQAIAPTLP